MTPSMRRTACCATVLAATFLTGCSSHVDSVRGTAAQVTTTPNATGWTNVGYGINGTSAGSGPNVLIVYGGYTATDLDSEALALELVSARLGGLGVGQVYAVRGPQDSGYAAREIGNSHLTAQLQQQLSAIGFIAVVAHSSGAFVADELCTQASSAELAKIVYLDLDGGSWALDNTLVGEMRGVYFVNADDSAAGESANYSAIVTLHADFPASHIFTVDSDGSGCNVGARWCLHDTLITTRPHKQTTYDLDDDYTDFTGTGRNVVTSYIDQGVADGVLPQPSAADGGSDAPAPAPASGTASYAPGRED
jgi:hypothetical protein